MLLDIKLDSILKMLQNLGSNNLHKRGSCSRMSIASSTYTQPITSIMTLSMYKASSNSPTSDNDDDRFEEKRFKVYTSRKIETGKEDLDKDCDKEKVEKNIT